MQQTTENRRQIHGCTPFPLVDSDGKQVFFERRSGKERRKNRRGSRIARNIINIIN